MSGMTMTEIINWWECAPKKDTFVCRILPDKSKTETESGLIIAQKAGSVQDRPYQGEVISVGPKAKYSIGDYLFWQPQTGFDLAMIRPTQEDEKFILLHPEAILGQKVKDTRETRDTRENRETIKE